MGVYAFDPPPPPTVAVDGQAARFPVRRILCVGRNYASHAREMGGDPDREPPFFFMKPADAVVDSGSVVPYPPETHDLHHEIELVVAIGARAFELPARQATSVIWGYAVGIDLTRRDLQKHAKEKARPWEWAKAFDHSAPVAPVRPVSEMGHLEREDIWLSVNGELRQQASLSEMIWSVPEIISVASRFVALEPGDLLFTGTPEGVGPLLPGDRVRGGVTSLVDIAIDIGPPTGKQAGAR